MSSDEKRIARKIKASPLGHAVTEALFAVAFTFLPIAFLSVPFAAKAGKPSWSSFNATFYKFWEAGQLALPILGVCGTVAALAALNGRGLPRFLQTIAWLVSIALSLACGFALAESNGFAEPLNNEVLRAGVWAYVLILILWIVVSVLSQLGVDRENPEERANKLLKDLRGDGANGGSK